jgi:hypothetical protein
MTKDGLGIPSHSNEGKMKITDLKNPRVLAAMRGAFDYFAKHGALGEQFSTAIDEISGAVYLETAVGTVDRFSTSPIIMAADIPLASRKAGTVAAQEALRDLREGLGDE